MEVPKLLFVMNPLPRERIRGTNVVMTRLLDTLPPDRVMVAGFSGSQRKSTHPYSILRFPSVPERGHRYGQLLAVPFATWQLVRAAKQFGAEAIVAVFPSEASLLIGYLAHKVTHLPLVAYFCDLYLESGGSFERLARWLQPRVFREASQLLTLNESMDAFYKERYGISTTVLPTAINTPLDMVLPSKLVENQRFVIGFNGTITVARIEGLQILLEAVGDHPDYEIRLFTPTPHSKLRELGLDRPSISSQSIDDTQELIKALSACDALYFPLVASAYDVSYEQLATCLGTKAYDYLIARRPVVILSPPTYFTAQFFSRSEAGLIVGEPNAADVFNAFEKLRQDRALGKCLAENAFLFAKQFEGIKISRQFVEAVKLTIQGGN